MKRSRSAPTMLSGALLIVLGLFTFSSCEKMPGHLVNPVTNTGNTGNTGTTGSTGTTGNTGTIGSIGNTGSTGSTGSVNPNLGVGPIAIGALNTIIFQINGGKTYTWTTADHFFGLNNFSYVSTVINGFDSTATDALSITYDSTVAGTYTIKFLNLKVPGVNIGQMGTSEHIKVTSEALGIPGAGHMANGTVKGTFDGYAKNVPAGDSVWVSGSFNINQ